MNIGTKVILGLVFVIVLLTTIWICIAKPSMHKPFSVNTIEYLIKVNKDGSMTTTTQITETVIKGGENPEAKKGLTNEK